jgi:hypothetical protein
VNRPHIYGASPSEWLHFDWGLDLTADLLPVVSNPNATISPGSSLKALGKTPSLYNSNGLVVGIRRWTQRITTSAEIADWEKQPDYGICIQTRRLRAIDIDVDDRDRANEIATYLQRKMGVKTYRRWRENSGKCLLAFMCPGTFSKRVFKVKGGGQVEFLADGQQFVAVGTHPSGVKYQWS